MEVILGYERGERTTRNVIVTVDGGFARFCLLFSKRRSQKKKKEENVRFNVSVHETIEREKDTKGNFTYLRGRRRRKGGPEPIGRLCWRCSHRRGGRRLFVARREVVGRGPSRPIL
jgi:hypothetical protein